jgi:hypothetical protein
MCQIITADTKGCYSVGVNIFVVIIIVIIVIVVLSRCNSETFIMLGKCLSVSRSVLQFITFYFFVFLFILLLFFAFTHVSINQPTALSSLFKLSDV